MSDDAPIPDQKTVMLMDEDGVHLMYTETDQEKPLYCLQSEGVICLSFLDSEVHLRLRVNTFMLQTVQLLNKFAITCEEKLAEVSRRRHDLEIRIVLLEAQLNSIHRPPQPLHPSTPSSQARVGSLLSEGGGESLPGTSFASETPEPLSPPLEEEDRSQGQKEKEKEEEEEEEEEGEEGAAAQAAPKIQNHPLYARFFRMVRVGVPEQGVKRQMALEGLDPHLLDDPEGPFPIG